MLCSSCFFFFLLFFSVSRFFSWTCCAPFVSSSFCSFFPCQGFLVGHDLLFVSRLASCGRCVSCCLFLGLRGRGGDGPSKDLHGTCQKEFGFFPEVDGAEEGVASHQTQSLSRHLRLSPLYIVALRKMTLSRKLSYKRDYIKQIRIRKVRGYSPRRLSLLSFYFSPQRFPFLHF